MIHLVEGTGINLYSTAEFHSQTAIECAQRINKKLNDMGKSAKDIDTVTNRTHEACIRIIDKQLKPMDNFADRDHCVQVRQLPAFLFLFLFFSPFLKFTKKQ